MKAITVEPKKAGSAQLDDLPEPDARNGSVLVEAIAVGVCGTDIEITEGNYGWAPPGKTRLVVGHESLGRVLDPGPTGGLREGDLVVGIVRRPDPVPCPSCAVGEWDMCRNGQYTERGIKEIDGFMSERWRIEPEYAIKVNPILGVLGVLLEPMTVVSKALEHAIAVGKRAFWELRTVLVTGAGPIGLLGALLATQLGWRSTSSIALSQGSSPISCALWAQPWKWALKIHKTCGLPTVNLSPWLFNPVVTWHFGLPKWRIGPVNVLGQCIGTSAGGGTMAGVGIYWVGAAIGALAATAV